MENMESKLQAIFGIKTFEEIISNYSKILEENDDALYEAEIIAEEEEADYYDLVFGEVRFEFHKVFGGDWKLHIVDRGGISARWVYFIFEGASPVGFPGKVRDVVGDFEIYFDGDGYVLGFEGELELNYTLNKKINENK